MNVAKFLKEVREEVRKVNWPTRAETFKYAAIVLVVSLIVSIYLGAADFVITSVLERFI